MADVLDYDGFDLYGDTSHLRQKWTLVGSYGATVGGGNGRRGTDALKLSPSAGARLTLPSTETHLVVGFSYNSPLIGTVARYPIFNFESGGNRALTLIQEVDGKLTFQQGGISDGGGIVLLTPSGGVGTVVANSTRYIELEVKVDASAGQWALRIDGTTVLDSNASTDTQYLTYSTISSIMFGSGGATNIFDPSVFFVDDFYLVRGSGSVTTSMLGDCRVDAILPTADGTHTDLTPSSGSDHFEMVNDTTPDDDSTYLSGASGTDTFTFPSWGFTPTEIFAVGIRHTSKYNDSTMNITPVARVDGTDYSGSAHALASSYLPYLEFWEENPDTSSAWTKAEAEAAEFGLTITS